MDNKLQQLKSNINAEFELFRDCIISNMRPEEVFNNAYRINFYQQIQDYLLYVCSGDIDGVFDNNELDILINCGENLISNLYDEYITREYSRIGSYEECESLARDFIEVEKQCR